ncbi:hypothetical protein EW146_g7436 [Bondarzewia mesenterica]|uniref:Uncharacterized protein n=1 Tax=Bondarzewia mesenterica TaxID=1095465 RepID=A0A4S4LKS6_9AGAM|nr:hypothetical protein EW146_g7436 [Bondarzewia mesenterica]
MALSSTSPPALDIAPLITPTVTRSDSLQSSATMGSTCSLTRQPRTIRARSRTVTSNASVKRRPTLPEIDIPPVASPDAPPLPVLSSGVTEEAPVRPPRSPMRIVSSPVELAYAQDAVQGSSTGVGARAVDDAEAIDRARKTRAEEAAHGRTPRSRKRCSSVPRDAYRMSMLSGFSSPTSPLVSDHKQSRTMPPYTSFRDTRRHLRESMLTQQSGTSSSVYPFSTSTTSGTDSPPSPRSLVDPFPDNRISSVDPDELSEDYRGFNADDMSYRLRLLVNNNYFLPPAHSKPSPSDFAPAPAAIPKKTVKTAPAFLDMFRVGKSKPKPSTPLVTPSEDRMPVLRTTSDSTTASGWVTRPHALSLPHTPALPFTRIQERAGRVAVVREKMEDLATAAKQAEEDIKNGGDGRTSEEVRQDEANVVDDVIDPTDSVDVPLPSADSPFAVQTSNVHGFGIEDSVGAAVLAERLPPSSLNYSSDTDDEWRKALLHEAVGHSLNSPATVSMSLLSSPNAPSTASPSTGSADRSFVQSPPQATALKRKLEQRIVKPEVLVQVVDSGSRPSSAGTVPRRPSSNLKEPRTFMAEGRRSPSRSSQSHVPPRRAETPAVPANPLPPPPRKQIFHAVSQTNLHRPGEDYSSTPSRSSSASRAVRKTMSSPLLHDLHEVGVRTGRSVMTPTPPLPPLPIGRSAVSPAPPARWPREQSAFHPAHQFMNSLTSGSHYSMDERNDSYETKRSEDGGVARSSFTASLPSRPSLSEYSQPSPTVSAFQDGLYDHEDTLGPPHNHSVNTRLAGLDSVSSTSTVSPVFRQIAMSPPPRVSSSIGTTVLCPPPRSSSFRSCSHIAPSPRPSITSSDPGHSTYASAIESIEIRAPEPTTPPYPVATIPPPLMAERRGHPALAMLNIPASAEPPAIHSAPPPSASSIDYFDHIQMHPNVMDDLDESSDSEFSDAESEIAAPSIYSSAPGHSVAAGATVTPQTPTRPSIMRLGNHSTPYVSSSSSHTHDVSRLVPSFDSEERRPVANVAPRATYFKQAKVEQGLLNLDLFQIPHPLSRPQAGPSKPNRPATSGGETSRSKREESLKRLDGLLIQHMEAERSTLSRIAKTAKATTRT